MSARRATALIVLLCLSLPAGADGPKPPGPPVVEPPPARPAKADKPAKPVEPAKADKPAKPVEPAKPVKPATHELYRDRSWTHIGDNNFSAQSDGADDLTRKAVGPELTVTIKLDARTLEVARQARWKSLILRGSVIGNDTGRIGKTTATEVRVGTTKVGEITRSGAFRIPLALRHLPSRPGLPLVITIVTGRNGASDRDDQELGRFRLLASEAPLPVPPAPKKKTPAPVPAPPRKK